MTEPNAIQTALRDSEDRLRRVLDQLFVFVGLTTLDGVLIEANQGPLRAAGLEPGDVLGKPFWDAYWWSYSPDVQSQLQAAIARAAVGETVRYEVPIRVSGEALITIDFQISPLRGMDGSITHLVPSGVVIEDRVRAEAELRRLASILEATPDFVGTCDAQGRALYLNPAARRVAGLGPEQAIEGRPIATYFPAETSEMLLKVALPAAVAEGAWEGESTFLAADGSTVPVSQVVIAHRNASGDVEYFSTVARDLSERKAAEDRERLLAREVDHRSKNLLAIVKSIVQLTRADDVAEMKASLSGRIQSLARTHSLLAASRWEGADLKKLITDELAPYTRSEPGRVRLQGPMLRLRPAAAQAFALVIHELGTNAVKHGSLSLEGGEVAVTWTTSLGEDRDYLRLRWQERRGPTITAPTRKGFGSVVTRTSVERQLKGSLANNWEAAGLTCDIDLPMVEISAEARRSPVPQAAGRAESPPQTVSLQGVRVLVVEDEALVAALIENALIIAGCKVIGPASRVVEALELLKKADVDVAILDVNVADEQSFPVADILMTMRIPFAFCTGYAEGALPERFRSKPILDKPFEAASLLELVSSLCPREAGQPPAEAAFENAPHWPSSQLQQANAALTDFPGTAQ